MRDFTSRLLGDLVMVLPESTRRPSGIILPDWQRSLYGSVLALGPEASDDLKKGDKIYFGAATGMESVFSGAAVRIMRAKDILCVVEEDDATA